MTARLSPSVDDVLLRHAMTGLDDAFSLLVETHLELSPAARAVHARFEALGGLLLEAVEPANVEPSALNRALAALDAEPRPVEPPARAATTRPDMRKGVKLPSTLSRQEIGPWRWIAPGVRSARIALPSASRAFLLEIGPGVRVPEHGHDGAELTCVLHGGFSSADAHYGVGDMACADASVVHDIAIDPDVPCLSLIAMEGRTRPSSMFGRLYQKFRDI